MKSKTNLIVGLVSILFCLLTSKLNAQLSGLPCASDALSKSLYLSDPQCQSFCTFKVSSLRGTLKELENVNMIHVEFCE